MPEPPRNTRPVSPMAAAKRIRSTRRFKSLVTGTGVPGVGTGILPNDFAFMRLSRKRHQSQARILYFALVVTVTFTLVESCVPSVTVKTLALPLLSAQETNTPAGADPRPCAILCCAPLPVCTADRNCFCFDG